MNAPHEALHIVGTQCVMREEGREGERYEDGWMHGCMDRLIDRSREISNVYFAYKDDVSLPTCSYFPETQRL